MHSEITMEDYEANGFTWTWCRGFDAGFAVDTGVVEKCNGGERGRTRSGFGKANVATRDAWTLKYIFVFLSRGL
jgi:hypothetical protein